YGDAPPPSSPLRPDGRFVRGPSAADFHPVLGLLALNGQPPPAHLHYLPLAPYAGYAPPHVKRPKSDSNPRPVPRKPFVWLRILGRDGFWPVASLTAENLRSADGRQPVASLFHSKVPSLAPSTLHETAPAPASEAEPAQGQ